MASSRLGALVLSELQSLSIDTQPEVLDFRTTSKVRPDMKTVVENIESSRGHVFASRKRIRHDAQLLFREGQL